MAKTDKQTAIVAAGCFWGVQFYFDQVPGVLETMVGYIGGHVDHPTYDQVCSHTTGHAEAVQIDFDPKTVDYETIIRQFFQMHDPTQLNRQGPDIGDSYRSAIFYLNAEQEKIAKKVLSELNASEKYKGKIVTTVEKAGTFWKAEDFHQNFTKRTGHGICAIPYAPLAA